VSSPRFEFIRNEAGEGQGLGDAGIETYRDSPYASVGREHGQNSHDARAEYPVRLTFDVLSIPVTELPGHADLLDTVRACLGEARDEKSKDFFTNALAILEKPEVPVLRIADFNTKGLIGPSIPGKPFHSLVKGAGISEAKSDTSGGSFGIGKNAAFAVSELQTVFYSTLYQEGDTERFLAQGKALLVSHTDASGKARRGSGYWGLPDYQPVTDPLQVPDWLRRSEIGTSVFVIGFRHTDDWAERIAASLVQNFFCAVIEEKLQFVLDTGSLQINKETIQELFIREDIRTAAQKDAHLEDLEFAHALLRCRQAPSEVSEPEVLGLGKVRISTLLEDGLPKRLMLVRNGMCITESLKHFKHPFVRFPMYREFVALIEPLDAMGNALIKKLENPRHDEVSAERIPNEAKRVEAAKVMEGLGKLIRETLKKAALPEPAEREALNELAEFFADRKRNDQPPQPGGEQNPEKLKYDVTPGRRRVQPPDARRGPGDAGGAGGGKNQARGGSKAGRGAGDGSAKGGSGDTGGGQEVTLDDVRNVIVGPSGSSRRRLNFTPAVTTAAVISVYASGFDRRAALSITSASDGTLSGGVLVLNLEQGKRVSLEIGLDTPYQGPVELSAVAAWRSSP